MIKIPLYPTYTMTIQLLKIIDGMPVQDFKTMWTTVWDLRGTPQNTVDWKNPDEWIGERLSGIEKEIALKIWKESNKTLNPRWTRGSQFLINAYKLIEDNKGIYQLTEKGKVFINNKENLVTKDIDIKEGLVQILVQLSSIQEGKRADLIDDWENYTINNSNLKKESVIKDYLRRRLVNLIDRKYVKKNGNAYLITELGKLYLDSIELEEENSILSKETKLSRKVESFTIEQRNFLKEYLKQTKPYQFEHIVKDLLYAMGYEDVEVTSPTNDKGVDVTGISQNGITTVKEVIQVKRNTTSNVIRPVLDSLRGSLHRFDAFQGTIITLSDFAKGAKDAAFEKGAAPITLINGEKLIDLLLKYKIGVSKKSFEYYVVDTEYFNEENEDNVE
ncbi:MAG: hypothetical protein BGO88_09830 [Flavobacterium sp. 38-13]|uniref:restriction endonuclease n=1 Tax=Flavobacterium sp. 38-13 TaxID=1896168 RepID=UPI00096580B2|nr:restriction endonuclease [Flavobacterium sp. 38-13]OJX53963.1 MAG: hypothetical protein BGO88_09830 [Flavobacterium sp. 38-13]